MEKRTCATKDCQRQARRSSRYCGKCCHARWPDNPERAKARQRAKTHRRKAVGRQTDITMEYEQELRRNAKRCPLCTVRMTSQPYLPHSKELDHMVPLGVGGTHTIGNVRIICRACNGRRPNDGSDYTGPVTLWATVPGFTTHRRPAMSRCAHGVVTNRRCDTCRPPIARCPHNVPMVVRCMTCRPRSTSCADCGATIDQPQRGRPRAWCLTCRPSTYLSRRNTGSHSTV